MAYICPYNGRKCEECPYYRWDNDYEDYICFMRSDYVNRENKQDKQRR